MHWIDPACLPETRGRVTQFLLNPHGEIDGLILNGDLQVHVPPHLGRELVRHVAVGDRIRVRGVKPRRAAMIAAVQLTGRGGIDIIDAGPEHAVPKPPRPPRQPMESSGEVAFGLHGPKGGVSVACRTRGVAPQVQRDAADARRDSLLPGGHVPAWGHGVVTPHGTPLDVREIAELVDADAE